MEQLKQKLDEILQSFKRELAGIRANRPTPKLVEDIKVDYLGQQLPIKQVASISIAPPREIHISVWDKNNVNAVTKAIEQASIGITPSVSGNLVIVSLPPLSQERRQELIKVVKQLTEACRIRVRAFRDEHNKETKRDDQLREDERFDQLKRIQELVDGANDEVGLALENKIKEIQE